MEVTIVAPLQKDYRVKYIPLEETRVPIISKGENHIGSIEIDAAVSCKQQCYLGLSLNTTGIQILLIFYSFLFHRNL